jgi:aminoglycoside 3-N-acetyltransferase
MRFDGVIFDVGDILYDASLWRRWVTEQLQSLGADVTYEQLVARWEALLVDVYRGRADYWERFRQLLRDHGLDAAQVEAMVEGAKEKGAVVQVDRKPFPGVPETLARLAAEGVKLAALSDSENGEEGVRGILRQLGIEQHFDAVIASRDIGFVKPQPEAYAAAVEALDLPKDRCVFVGHDIDELTGVQEVGIFGIGYNSHPDAPCDVRIGPFAELGGVVLDEDASAPVPLYRVDGREITRQDFIDGLAAAGVDRGDVCFVHSSVIAFGKPAAPAKVVMGQLVEALQEAVGPEGTIVMPTFTFSFCKDKVYDPARSKSLVGALTEYFRKCPDVVRTGHPIFSVAIWGKHRDELASVGKDSFGEDTIFAKLHALGGKLMLYGSPFPPTFKHYVEQCHGVPYRFMKTFQGKIQEGDAVREDEATFYVRHLDRNVVSDATRLEKRLESQGLIREAAVGGGRIRVMSATEFHDVVWSMLDEDIFSLLKGTPDL